MTTSSFPSSDPARRERGVALIIVLAFIVLLTGLIVAYFSRSMTDRQLSNSSFNGTKADTLALSAADIIIGDLKSEIADPTASTATTMGSGTNQSYLYTPKAGTYMLPLRNLPSAEAAAIPNLIRVSVVSDPIVSPGVASRASKANSTTDVSANGRSVSLARWNKHYFIPRLNTGTTVDTTPVASFTAPDWVLVDGTKGPQTVTAPNTSIVGRYAYAVYDEGGLLDINAAGYPYPSPTPSGTPYPAYKSSLAFADLTALPTSTASPAPTFPPAQVNNIVGWRNFASAQPDGNFSNNFTFSTTAATNYYNYVLSSTTGFIKTSLNTWNKSTDQMFLSRQQLLSFRSGVGFSQNVLQYLTTFSRDLNQPSFAPLPALNPPNATHRPAIVAVASGGNDAFTGDDIINPSFLKVRVTTSFKRFDPSSSGGFGADTVEGEPLVNKRFALSRLAWLTFKGPIASDTGTLSTDAEVQKLITALKASGFTDTFLKQGGPKNIYNYFGLSWVADPSDASQKLWVYSHQGTAPLASATSPTATIKTLSGGSNPISGREADFFELLRAGINVGSLGKASAAANPTTPDGYQAQRDLSTNGAIIQIAANIIDQFDGDGYPTRIRYNEPGWTQQEYRGVEDLPYFYRVRGALMKVKESTPVAFTARTMDPPAGTVVAGNEGMGVAFQQPEIWNPHTWNPTATAVSLRPTTFRLTAVTALPNLTAPASPDPNVIVTLPGNRYNTAGYRTCPPNATPVKSISWAQDTTALLFDIPLSPNRQDLFREPTLLIKPQVPTGSNLRYAPTNLLATEAILAPYRSGGGIKNLKQSGFYTNNGVTDDQKYIGIYMGAFPLAWNDKINNVASICNAFLGGGGGKPATYRVQYETAPGSNKWVTYDEKCYTTEMQGLANAPGVAGSRANFIAPENTIGSDSGRQAIDPRTARLQTVTCAWQFNQSRRIFEWPPTYSDDWFPPFAGKGSQFTGAAAPTSNYTASSANTHAAAQNAIWTIRPDVYNGFKAYPFPFALGFYPGGMNAANSGPQFRPGLFSQNNPSATVGGSATDNGVGQGNTGTTTFFADPDNVVRRGMAAYLRPNGTDAGQPPMAGAASGEPQAVATSFSSAGIASPLNTEAPSRPIMLNRPFRTVAEMGNASSGTPWRNLDFSTPESGFSALLDVFSINDTDNADGLVAGKVNLNTRQAPVLQAILAGAYKDEFSSSALLSATGTASANTIATELVRRTSDTAAALGTGSGPLQNISELVGKWTAPATALGSSFDGGKSYKGFSGIEATSSSPVKDPPNLSYILSQDPSAAGYNAAVAQRYREASIRALTAAGQTRVWNLMIDVVAQAGRYPTSAAALDKFVVEGEQRYWVHVAIDRYSGKVIDKQIEVVKE